MKIPICSVLFLLFYSFSFIQSSLASSHSVNVTYDSRSLFIDGKRKLILSGSIHYPRSVPAMWPGLIKAAKEGGLNTIESYVFWSGHERTPGNYYFKGRYDLVKFVKTVQKHGMYMILRIGPFVAAEYNYGGIPVWLHYVQGTAFRTYNKPFMSHMQRFLTFIVKMMKKEKLFASQGGPIILAQVENEYSWYEQFYKGGKKYMLWAAKMAVSQNTGVPWIMCEEWDAPDPVIDTCNDFYCDTFKPHSPNMPKVWTENWPGWFRTFGSGDPHRPAEDVAYSVARFIQKGGSVHNYYMYHGGTNFGRTSGLFITTSYDYDAPIDEYGIPRNPKWGHLKELHRAIMSCEHALLFGKQSTKSLGPNQEVDVYFDSSSGACAAFLSNMDNKTDATVVFRNVSYHLPAWSVSILPDCKRVLHNTAIVRSQTSIFEMVPEKLEPSSKHKIDSKALKWEVYKEMVGTWGQPNLVKSYLQDHLNTTKDASDYLWYTTSIIVDKDEEFLNEGSQPPVLLIQSKGHAQHVFVNHKILEGSATGSGSQAPYSYSYPISLKAGTNHIAILSMTVGLQSAGTFYEFNGAGPISVKITGFNNGTVDLSKNHWSYKIGLEGEDLGIYKPDCLKNVNWISATEPPKNQSLTWYKVFVKEPPGHEPIGMDMLHMGKGQAWLNGEAIGRYWPRISNDDCVKECDYRGKFSQKKCVDNCGKPTQRWYHIPRSWFKPTENLLVFFEEKGGDPTKIRFSRRKVSGTCALVGEDHPHDHHENGTEITLHLHLKCPKNTHISAVKFASYGTPKGTCGSYSTGDCHDANSVSIVEKVCLHKHECKVELKKHEHFDGNLCPGATKKLAVEVKCS